MAEIKGRVLIRIGILAAFPLVFSACSGSGYGGPTGGVCPTTYDPIPIELNKNLDSNGPQKLALDDTGGGLGTYPGTFEYQGSEIYYHNLTTGIQVHVADVKNTKAVSAPFTKSNVCVNGFKLGMGDKDFVNTKVITRLALKSGEKITFDVKNVRVKYIKRLIQKDYLDDDSSKFQAPGKVYEGSSSQFYLYRMGPTTNQTAFEIRSKEVRNKALSGEDSETYTVVRFTRILPDAVKKQ